MTRTFISHELKSFWRSKNAGKTLTIRIVMGLLILYLLACVLLVAFALNKILEKSFPTQDPVTSFCGILLFYFLIDLLMRFQLQELPTLRVQPYLMLPVRKNTIVRYLSFVSLQSFFNLTPLILFTPFIVKVIRPEHGAGIAWLFIAAILGLTVFNNYLSLYIKRKSNLNGWVSLGFLALLILLGASDFAWHILSFSKISFLYFGHLLTQPAWVLIPIAMAVAMFYINFLYLKQNLYLEELTTRKVSYKSSTEIPLLDKFGQIGDLAANEVKLILRNKRPRSALVMTLMFMFYGLLFYTGKIAAYNGDGWKVFCGMFMTGIFIINYGQFMYGWQAGHFDGILVSKTRFRDFLKAKYLLFTAVSFVAFLLTTPYAYFGWHIILVHFVMLVWNIGVNTTIVLFFANRNYKRIDLSKGASFNWEGVGATQLLLGFPLFILPFVIYGPFALFKHADMGLAVLFIVGLVFVITRNYWIKLLETDFYEKKYKIAEGFRAK
ncbi:hypothetical protein BEL04_22670 [Mucilaginibacter sp. PPCGB 2223]|uniref:DUF5687 family protein n=1 Tax=Mucilaginibacter sp. PPCGB 2223 TaxID=1886027 RepID=UPI0008256A15|nr:DUF5687 family protein [Mucilaginibacter sp. PPCGB 2223]OCX50582.1 hypothetical protein BEL04_22670 [Mucilaginibacter sp. PPCGB 2223]